MDSDISRLLRKYVRKECTPEEMKEVVRFFQESGEMDSEMLPSGEEVLQILEEKEKLDEKSAARLYRNIMVHSGNRKRKKVLGRKTTKFYAAAAVLVVLIGSLFLREYFKQEQAPFVPPKEYVTIEFENGQKTILKVDSLQLADETGNILGVQKGTRLVYAPEKEITSLRYNSINVPYGKRFELSLSDGTLVYLNAGTSIKFPVGFVTGMKREVFISGEAYFDVAEDRDHPFIVNTGSLAVEVLGTEFNVEAYEENDQQKIVLVEGSVKIDNDRGENILMSPNQMVVSTNGTMKKSSVTASDFISWKEGYLTLKEASTEETILLLERYYNIKIHSQGEEEIDQIVGSGKIYLSEDVENVITTLSLLTNNKYSYEYSKLRATTNK